MINLVKLFKYYKVKILFTISLTVFEECKYGTDMMRKLCNNEIVMTKEDDEDFENSNKCWICDNIYVDCDLKVRDHCHITGKYKDCNINLNLPQNCR